MVSSAPLLVPGMKLGKYQLLRRLAVGGMAEIYLGKATGIEGFEKLVVLKRILPQHASNEEFIAMFLNEAKLAATLHHPNIAQTYDIGSDGGSYFFTMEYVHGEDMRQIAKAADKRGREIGIEHAVNVVLGVCAGLHHAHEKLGADGRPLGIVHRDVSPSNLIVSHDGMVKLVDFGIAKATTHRAETRVGTLKGKIAYMSPEQCRGERLDRRADVFAIGILLYEFSTGKRLFQADNEFAILNMIVNDDVPPPSTIVPGYPEGLERVVMKALRRNRDQRYLSAQEMQVDLEAFARSERLMVSSVSLARFMEDLFGKRLDPWREITRKSGTGQTPALDVLDLPLPAPANTGQFEGPDFPAALHTTMPGFVPPSSFASEPASEPNAPRLDSAIVAAESSRLVAPIVPRRRRTWIAGAGVLVLAAGVTLAVALSRGAHQTAEATAAPATSAPPATPAPAPAPPPVQTVKAAPPAAEAVVSTPAPPAPPPAPPVAERKKAAPARTAPARPVVRAASRPTPQRAVEKSDKPDKPAEPEKPKEWDPDSPLPPPGH